MSEVQNKAPSDEQDAAPVADQAQQPPGPTPEQIAELVKGQARMQMANATLAFITNQMNEMLNMLTGGNTRMCLAVVNELHVTYDEAVRRTVKVVAPQQPQPQPEQPQQDNQPEAKELADEDVADDKPDESQKDDAADASEEKQ